MELLTWQIGRVRVTRVEERIHGVVRDTLVPGITDDDLARHASWAAPYFSQSGRLLLSVHTFVVESRGVTIVVDTCVGTARERPLPGDPAYLARLGAAVDGGIGGVDVVLCTHLHFDHVGWNTVVGAAGQRVPTFPNARYLVTQAELDDLDADDHDEIAALAVQPLLAAGALDPVATDHRITPEVRLLPTPGHTPGHVSVVVESDGESALITGDAVHSPIQFAHPELAAAQFDADHELSTATRRELIARYADSGTLVLGTHFAPPTAGHVRRRGNGIVFVSPGARPDPASGPPLR